MTAVSPKVVRIWFWAGLALTAFKLWLTRGQAVYAIGNAALDDRLFLQLAESIVQGDWLGVYSQATLAKGPFYPMFVVGLFWIGLPLGLGVQLAYAGACAAFTRACGPAIRSGAVRLAMYALLLWNPMSFEAPTMGRIIRQQIYTPLGLAVFAGLVGLYCRRDQSVRRQLPWALLTGLAFGCFWLTREESIWLVPSVLLLAGAAVFWAFRLSRAHGRTMLHSFGHAAFCAALPLLLVSWQNYRHYGWFGTVEFRAAEFKDAYGAMMRVKVGPDLAYVPVTRQAREAMYAVSPTFAKLQPYFEGDYGRGWAGASTYVTKLPPEERQIGGGWLMWALRDCVAAAGYCHNAREALDFYRRMADEINAACDAGKLPASGHRSGFLPPLKSGQAAAIARTVGEFADFTIGFRSFSVYPPLSIGDRDQLLLFHDLTRDAISSSVQAPAMPLRNQDELNQWKYARLQAIGRFMRPLILVLFFTAQLVALVRLLQTIRHRKLTFAMVLAAAAWGGSLAYLLVNAMVHVTSFPVTAVSTFSPIYPLLLVFILAAFWDAAEAWVGRTDRTPAG
jgi:Ca2+/Na+ antiporter